MPLSLEELERIKKLAITAMFSDDDLMDTLVLKGGNALDLIYKIGTRASGDLDFSMNRAFTPEELEAFPARVEALLQAAFEPEGYKVLDMRFAERPRANADNPDLDFWSGYKIEFKLVKSDVYDRWSENLNAVRNRAEDLGKSGGKGFEIEISKFEYTDAKQEGELEGYTIYVYTPEMIVCEKLRAICQQMPEYGPIVNRNRDTSARARDFFDIHTVIEIFKIDLTTEENKELLRNIFEAKRVPMDFLGRVSKFREFHRAGFESLKGTVKAGIELKDFDFYFDYVLEKVSALESLWEV
jgi:hypothetical protein